MEHLNVRESLGVETPNESVIRKRFSTESMKQDPQGSGHNTKPARTKGMSGQDKALSHLFSGSPYREQWVGRDDPHKSFPIQVILWICYSMIIKGYFSKDFAYHLVAVSCISMAAVVIITFFTLFSNLWHSWTIWFPFPLNGHKVSRNFQRNCLKYLFLPRIESSQT